MSMKDNFKEFWKEHIFGHFGGPLLCVTLAIVFFPFTLPAIAGPLAQMWRQTVGFWQKQDTVSMDMSYIVAGIIAGSVLGTFVLRFWGGIVRGPLPLL